MITRENIPFRSVLNATEKKKSSITILLSLDRLQVAPSRLTTTYFWNIFKFNCLLIFFLSSGFSSIAVVMLHQRQLLVDRRSLMRLDRLTADSLVRRARSWIILSERINSHFCLSLNSFAVVVFLLKIATDWHVVGPPTGGEAKW